MAVGGAKSFVDVDGTHGRRKTRDDHNMNLSSKLMYELAVMGDERQSGSEIAWRKSSLFGGA